MEDESTVKFWLVIIGLVVLGLSGIALFKTLSSNKSDVQKIEKPLIKKEETEDNELKPIPAPSDNIVKDEA